MKFEFLIGTVGFFILSSIFVASAAKGGAVAETPRITSGPVDVVRTPDPVFLVPEKVTN